MREIAANYLSLTLYKGGNLGDENSEESESDDEDLEGSESDEDY